MRIEVFFQVFELWLQYEDKQTAEDQKMYYDEDGYPVDEHGNPLLEDHEDGEVFLQLTY